MSGAAFEGLENLSLKGDAGSYAPGSPGFDPLLLREMMGLYEQGPDQAAFINDIIDPIRKAAAGADSTPAAAGYIALIIADAQPGWEFSDAREKIGYVLGRGKERIAHADGFIAAAIGRMDDAEGDGKPYQKDIFIDALVQALYDQGHNDFMIDLRGLRGTDDELRAGCRLQGKEGAPLRASYASVPLTSFGCEVSHCELSLEGGATFAGQGSEHSVLRLGGKLGVMTFGLGSKQCRFYLGSPPDMFAIGGDSWENEIHIAVDGDQQQGKVGKALASDEILAELRDSGFFGRENRLFFHYTGGVREVAR